MTDINKVEFMDNLRLTQEHCSLQIQGGYNSKAISLRSYNPESNGLKLFNFETKHFEFDVVPGLNNFVSAKWPIDPIEDKTIITHLFKDQLLFKYKSFTNSNDYSYSGKILISQLEFIIPDGASEAESLGFIDQYDIPPIDTWFYMASHKGGRLLFAWIPDEFIHDVNEAIAVNMLDCISWFEVMLPEEYENLKPLLGIMINNEAI